VVEPPALEADEPWLEEPWLALEDEEPVEDPALDDPELGDDWLDESWPVVLWLGLWLGLVVLGELWLEEEELDGLDEDWFDVSCATAQETPSSSTARANNFRICSLQE
jgi:hypothetical protein